MVNVTIKSTLNWNTIDWKSANRVVQNLRQRIFRATREGEIKKVRSLQRLLLRSYSNRVLSIRRVTQMNKGKKTPGVDQLIVKTPSARARLVEEIATYSPERSQPVRRIYIPKKEKGKFRPLGIPVILDRAMQALVKNVLEPYWEAKFEATSYGFRRGGLPSGRGCHDAIERIFCLANGYTKKKWVVDFDIRGAFDHVSWNHLLKAIGNFPARGLIKQWLKAGYMELGEVHQTTSGTPQGGVISPLLLNIALHGMEEALGIEYNEKKGRITSKRALVRYADDAVVLCETKEDAQEVMKILEKWLAERGLEGAAFRFSPQKTQIAHIADGFNFLSFNIRQYESPSKTGWKLLIKPSKDSVNKIRERLRKEWNTLKGKSVEQVIKVLNPIIRGQAHYYRSAVAGQTFNQLDHYLCSRQLRWAKWNHPNKSKAWRQKKYWGQLNPNRCDHWVFGNKKTGGCLLKYSWFSIKRHILVKGRASPDDQTLKNYWKKRTLKGCKDLKANQRHLAEKQHGICPICSQPLLNGEDRQMDHIIPKSKGGLVSDTSNLQLLHLFCHQQKTYQDRSGDVAA